MPIGIFSEKDYRTVQDAIGDLQNVPTVTDVAEDIGTPLKKADDISELGKSLRDTDTLFNHIITKTRETAMERFKAIKQGEKKNHMGVDVQDDVCLADYNDIQKKYGKIDVVIGGPPCQGFSNANRQKNHAISQNNMFRHIPYSGRGNKTISTIYIRPHTRYFFALFYNIICHKAFSGTRRSC